MIGASPTVYVCSTWLVSGMIFSIEHGSINLTPNDKDAPVSNPKWSSPTTETVYVFASYLSLELKVNTLVASSKAIIEEVTALPSTSTAVNE